MHLFYRARMPNVFYVFFLSPTRPASIIYTSLSRRCAAATTTTMVARLSQTTATDDTVTLYCSYLVVYGTWKHSRRWLFQTELVLGRFSVHRIVKVH